MPRPNRIPPPAPSPFSTRCGRFALWFTMVAAAGSVGCGGDATDPKESDAGPAGPIAYEAVGPHRVGNRTVVLHDGARGRELRVEIWYPAADETTAGGEAMPLFAAAGPDRDALTAALAGAATACVNSQTTSTRDATPLAGGKWPVLTFSHCHLCARFSSFSLAEYLASHGFAVIATDHTGGTMFDKLAGDNEGLTESFLMTRAADVRFLLDTVLGAGEALPADLRGRFDAGRVGAFGHSFGSVTTGRVAQTDDRVLAAAGLFAPFESPLPPGVKLAEIAKPVLFFVATEDNSISEFGNNLIRGNFDKANPPVWKVEIVDAGHLSVSDLCGMGEGFNAGCGDGSRQTRPGEPFTYIPVKTAIALTQTWLGYFFGAHVRGEAEALSWLQAPPAHGDAVVDMRLAL